MVSILFSVTLYVVIQKTFVFSRILLHDIFQSLRIVLKVFELFVCGIRQTGSMNFRHFHRLDSVEQLLCGIEIAGQVRLPVVTNVGCDSFFLDRTVQDVFDFLFLADFIKTNERLSFMWIADQWKDYEVIDCSKGEKLERWGQYTLIRPDPQVIWDTPKTERGWKHMNGHYHRSKKGGGEWEFFSLPEQWQIHYKELTFNLKPFSFKHTGLFPEQATNWDWFSEKIRNAGRPIKVLNLFAYTGGATLASAAAGASVTHVDASKGMVAWAKENAASSGLSDRPIRWLVDDCVKFVEREIRRGNHYDAIIMDPPSYGRGPKGEIWKIEDAIHPLIKLCTQILSDDPLFFLVNSYTTGLAPAVLTYMLGTELKKWNGHVDSQEIGLPVTHSGLVLPCGASGRWEAV